MKSSHGFSRMTRIEFIFIREDSWLFSWQRVSKFFEEIVNGAE